METAKVSLFVCLAAATGLGTWYLSVRAPDKQWRLAEQAGKMSTDYERFAEAERQFTMAIEAARVFGDQDSRRALSLFHLANVVCIQGRHTEAISLGQQALAINEKTLGSEHPDVASCLVHFGPDTTQTLVVSASETARNADRAGDSHWPGETARFVREAPSTVISR